MRLGKNITLLGKFSIFGVSSFVLLLLAISVAYFGMTGVTDRITKHIDGYQSLTLQVDQLYAHGLQMEQALRNVLLNPQDTLAKNNYYKAKRDFEQILKSTLPFSQSMPTYRQYLVVLPQLWDETVKVKTHVMQLVEDGKRSEAEKYLVLHETTKWRRLKNVLLECREKLAQAKAATNLELHNHIKSNFYLTTAVMAVAILLMNLMLYALWKVISSSMNNMVQGLNNIARTEHLVYSQLDEQGRDEIAQAAHWYNVFIDKHFKLTEELEKNKRELEIKNNELFTILESATTGIAFFQNRTIVLCNDKLEKIFGYSPGELTGLPIRVWYPNETLYEQVGHSCYPTVGQGEIYQVDIQLVKKDGSIFWARLTGQELQRPEGDKGMVGVIEDITNERENSQSLLMAKHQAEGAAKLKTAFLANMSHEIRTPMNAIIGLSQLLLKTELSIKQHNYLEKITLASQHLLRIIDDILDFSKIEAGKLALENNDFELEQLFSNLDTLIHEKAQKKGLELIFRIDSSVPLWAVGDSLRLGQILLNLANNAIKFTEQGEVIVAVRLIEESNDQLTLHFSVEDSGIGLTKQQKGRLFNSFEQADVSTTRQYGGTGLGLAISKQLVHLMGGEIGVDSEPDHGSCFWFTAKVASSAKTKVAKPLLNPDLRGLRSLVVDDNDSARCVLNDMLNDLTLDVALASSGSEALEMIQQSEEDGSPFRIVLLDWKMPDLDGIETAKRIGALALKTPPRVIIVSACSREEVLSHAGNVAIDDVLFKPIAYSTLFDTLLTVVSRDYIMTNPSADSDDSPTKGLIHFKNHILLVEDNELNQEVAIELLEAIGMRVSIANNGKIGVDMAAENEYDLILMDMQMPVMDGLTATRLIHQLPDKSDVPIIAMTANVLKEERQRCFESGMVDFIPKPISPDHLVQVLAKWLKEKTPERPSKKNSQQNCTLSPWQQIDSLSKSDIPADDQPSDDASLRTKLESIRTLLIENDLQALEVYDQIREKLSKKYGKENEELEQLINNFSFDLTIEIVNRWLGR